MCRSGERLTNGFHGFTKYVLETVNRLEDRMKSGAFSNGTLGNYKVKGILRLGWLANDSSGRPGDFSRLSIGCNPVQSNEPNSNF